eukprot:s2627_g3.t1
MGKARPQKSQQSWDSQRDDQDWSGHGSYRGRWWSGAFKTWGKYSPKAKARGKAFPRYDVEWQDPGISVVAETRLQEPPKRNSLAKVIQDAVNLLRNAEGRIQKLNSDIQEKARRWETYQSELQKSIQQEYHRHLAALDRLEQEIADATSQEENAKELLARAMAGAAAQEPNTQAGKAWASLIAGIPGEAAMDIDADSIGRRLDEFLHAPTLGGPASTPAPASVHVPSQASGPPGLPEPPDTTFWAGAHTYAGGSPSVARADPYLSSSPLAAPRGRSITRPAQTAMAPEDVRATGSVLHSCCRFNVLVLGRPVLLWCGWLLLLTLRRTCFSSGLAGWISAGAIRV